MPPTLARRSCNDSTTGYEVVLSRTIFAVFAVLALVLGWYVVSLNNLDDQIGNVDTNILALTGRVAAIEPRVEHLESDVAELKARLSRIEPSLARIEAALLGERSPAADGQQ